MKIKTNNKTNLKKEMLNMKKLTSIILSIIMILSAVSAVNFSAFAYYNDCECCDECTGDYDCECGCDDCECEDDEDCEDEDDEDDEDDEGDDEDDEDDTNEPQYDEYSYNAGIEGTDPSETNTKYTDEEKAADDNNLISYQNCGIAMFWYVRDNNLIIFGKGKMYDYSSYAGTPWSGCKYTDVIIRTGVASVSPFAFYGTSIKSVTFPSTVQSIGNYAFANCKNLENVKLGKNTVSVGRNAFYRCTSLNKVTINNSLEFLGESAFEGCTAIVKVRFPSTLETIEKNSFKGCTSLSRAVLRSGLTKICESAFEGCNSLAVVNFPDSLINIGTRAFYSCPNLKSVPFGTDLNTIGKEAFAYSGVLCTVFQKNAYKIDSSLFNGCPSVEAYVYENHTVYKALSGKNNIVLICAKHYEETIAPTPATIYADGIASGIRCKACGNVLNVKEIAKISSVNLSKSAFAFNEKAQYPSIKAVDRNGKPISSKNYKVEYSAGSCYVGTYTVKVNFTGNYSGNKTFTYTMNPQKTKLTKAKGISKALNVTWNKKTSQVTGYEIQYSTSSNFSNAKTETVKKNSTTSTTIKKLTANKKYYVRIRTYKTVGKKNYYSAWSSTKKASTKK